MPWLNCSVRTRRDVGLDLLPVLIVAADALAVAADGKQAVQLFDVGERRLELEDALAQLFLQRDDADTDVDAGAQLVDVERLGDVIVRAGIEAGDDILAAAERREQYQVHVRAGHVPADAAADLGAVEAGHHPIEHGQRRRGDAFEMPPCFGAVGDHGHVEFPAAQRLREHGRGNPIVVRDEHFHAIPPDATPL